MNSGAKWVPFFDTEDAEGTQRKAMLAFRAIGQRRHEHDTMFFLCEPSVPFVLISTVSNLPAR